jgi:hypothetical protein
MNKQSCVFNEYNNLKEKFDLTSLEPSKAVLVDELLKQSAFMITELSILREQISTYGSIQISKKGKQRQSEPAKYYTKLVASFSSTLKTINSILGKTTLDTEDDFDNFLKGIENR